MFNFEKLEVWQEATRFAELIYEVTESFPEQERFGLTNQMRRAAVSVSSNLAEGSSRSSRIDFARLVGIGIGTGVSPALLYFYGSERREAEISKG